MADAPMLYQHRGGPFNTRWHLRVMRKGLPLLPFRWGIWQPCVVM